MLIIHMFPCLSDNYAFLVRDSATGKVACIDTPDATAILAEAQKLGWHIDEIWNTHWHPDHAGGNQAIEKALGTVSLGPEEVQTRISPLARVVRPGETVTLGESSAEVIDVGGHTLGHIAFYFADDEVAFVGDSLFALGCGRLFEGTAEQAWNSLSRLMALPDATTIYCAHEYTAANARFCATIETENAALTSRIQEITRLRADNVPTVPTSIGLERATNPFMRADLPSVRVAIGVAADAAPYEAFARVRQMKDQF
ncbi:MAG TPA: hydroxyacylglutathione hydrolase [Hyphomonadaceae bacterium]|nr:hydroxyacylglutathione hydrolase [Hyphomonadaceae bacterium UKL13-1]HCP63445.1 hydroxyacylglutathione hydrolase [Hyphomonadaceae bacterium]